MFEVQTIQDEFMGLVGLRQTNNPVFDTLSSDIVKSDNNVLIQHPLLNIENLDMTSRNYGQYDFDAYSAVVSYSIGDKIKDSNIVYESLINANLANTPASSPASWATVSLLSLYLEDIFRNGIDDVVNGFLNEKKLRSETKTLLNNLILYEGIGTKNNLIVNEGNLVGFKVHLKHSRNLMALIQRIGHQFTQTGDLDLIIYHSSQQRPITSITITRTKGYSMEWTKPAEAIKLHHILNDYDAGGAFYIMYDQDSVPGQAIKKNHVWGSRPCATCSDYNIRSFNSYSKYMTIESVKVAAADRATVVSEYDDLWDIDATQYTNDINYGLNFEFSIRCDLTEMLVQNKDVFAFALRDNITVKLLESISNSTRQNGLETIVKSNALIALQSKSVGGGGLRDEAAKQIKAIDFEFSGFNDYCLPCNNKAGLTFGATSLPR